MTCGHSFGGTPIAIALESRERGFAIDIFYVNWYNEQTEGNRSVDLGTQSLPFP